MCTCCFAGPHSLVVVLGRVGSITGHAPGGMADMFGADYGMDMFGVDDGGNERGICVLYDPVFAMYQQQQQLNGTQTSMPPPMAHTSPRDKPEGYRGCATSIYCVRDCHQNGRHIGRGVCKRRKPGDWSPPPGVLSFEEETKKLALKREAGSNDQQAMKRQKTSQKGRHNDDQINDDDDDDEEQKDDDQAEYHAKSKENEPAMHDNPPVSSVISHLLNVINSTVKCETARFELELADLRSKNYALQIDVQDLQKKVERLELVNERLFIALTKQ